MNDEEYRIWRRRLRFAGYLAIDAYSARNNGNSELAEETSNATLTGLLRAQTKLPDVTKDGGC